MYIFTGPLAEIIQNDHSVIEAEENTEGEGQVDGEGQIEGEGQVESENHIEGEENEGEEYVQEDNDNSKAKVERKWKRKLTQTPDLSEYNQPEGINENEFIGCDTALGVFLKILGPAVEKIVFQSNLYAIQKGKTLNLTEDEFLCFIGINFLMGYHQLPSLQSYWNTSRDLNVSLVSESMSRNRFQEILSYLHVNDNSLLSKENKDKIYKIRPLLEILNNQFRLLYYGTRQLSVDESIVKFKGRSVLKQYNPMKPVKRGYKLWCLSDQYGFIKKLDIYQGKNEAIEAKYKEYTLGERVVLHLTEEEWGKKKFIYFDNYYTTLNLLEVLHGHDVFACGTIRNNRKGLPKNIKSDKMLKRGEADIMISNTNITYCKWKDSRVVHAVSNFHGTEETIVQRRDKTGKKCDVTAPSAIKDYNKYMGGVDRADRLRYCYTIDRRSKKWWHRLFWAMFEIAFVNSYNLSKHFLSLGDCTKDLLTFRRDLTLGLINLSPLRKIKKRVSGSQNATKRRRYNYSVPDSVRLENLGHHWIQYQSRRARCELCSSKGIQSKPFSMCSACKVYLCCNEKKHCFVEYHGIDL